MTRSDKPELENSVGYSYSFLTEDQFPQIHRTFREAFADYFVDTSGVTERLLYDRAVKNGVDFDLSVGVFEGDTMVGVTIVGVDRWKGKFSAYDIGTGVVPAHRGRGIAKKMFEFGVPKLKSRGVEKFVLEVIQENAAAIKAYTAAGFYVTREFDCYSLAIENAALGAERKIPIEIRPVAVDQLDVFEAHQDWRPSWENSFASIRRIPGGVELSGAFAEQRCIGVLVYYPALNWIMSLVVMKEYRRKGVASALLAKLVGARRGRVSYLKLNNVDHTDRAMSTLLDNAGFELTVKQFEMEYDL